MLLSMLIASFAKTVQGRRQGLAYRKTFKTPYSPKRIRSGNSPTLSVHSNLPASAPLRRLTTQASIAMDYWCVWVVELRKIAMKSNLPYGEREDGKEYDSDAPSAFVALINKLQNYLPKEYRRRAKTTSALAKHINRCRVAREGSGTN